MWLIRVSLQRFLSQTRARELGSTRGCVAERLSHFGNSGKSRVPRGGKTHGDLRLTEHQEVSSSPQSSSGLEGHKNSLNLLYVPRAMARGVTQNLTSLPEAALFPRARVLHAPAPS